jgi:hypothetical protein
LIHDAIYFQQLVPGHDNEEVRVRTNPLVLLHVELDRVGAVLLAALAEKLDRPPEGPNGLAHALVDLSKEDLAADEPLKRS